MTVPNKTNLDPTLWAILDALGANGGSFPRASKLAAATATVTGYAGAYRSIGRAVAAGYVQYIGPVTTYDSFKRLGVALTDRGRRRWADGQAAPQLAVTAWLRDCARDQGKHAPLERPARW